jgi:hypothetical protein
MDSANLALHGIHPRYMHLLVNLPMLYTALPVRFCFEYELYNLKH